MENSPGPVGSSCLAEAASQVNYNSSWSAGQLCITSFPPAGPVDPSCEAVTGEVATYLYPDLKTCLTGTFSHSRLVSAKLARITSVEAESLSCPALVKITTEPVSDYLYSFSQTFSGPSLLHRDPYEVTMVEVRKSLLAGAGEGVFLKREAQPNTVLAFYNGVRLPPEADEAEADWEKCSYRIFLSKPLTSQEEVEADCDILDIPEEMRSLDKYCATVAHKVNHSFEPCGAFRSFHHPLHGDIKCVVATCLIPAGSELTTDYKYPLDDCPAWYSDLWEQL